MRSATGWWRASLSRKDWARDRRRSVSAPATCGGNLRSMGLRPSRIRPHRQIVDEVGGDSDHNACDPTDVALRRTSPQRRAGCPPALTNTTGFGSTPRQQQRTDPQRAAARFHEMSFENRQRRLPRDDQHDGGQGMRRHKRSVTPVAGRTQMPTAARRLSAQFRSLQACHLTSVVARSLIAGDLWHRAPGRCVSRNATVCRGGSQQSDGPVKVAQTIPKEPASARRTRRRLAGLAIGRTKACGVGDEKAQMRR